MGNVGQTSGLVAQGELSILIVEDDRTSASLLRALIGKSSLSVSEIKAVGRLDDALKCLDQSSYNVVLLDLNLPDSCGTATLVSVAKDHSNLAIVVITGEHDENLAMDILAKGAQDYLIKGHYSGDVLVKTIRYALGRAKEIEARTKELEISQQQLNQRLNEANGQRRAMLNIMTDLKESEEEKTRAFNALEKAHHDLKIMQSQSIQNEKLASIGQLAAGVAHEMNTPVGFVASNFQTLESYMKKFLDMFAMYEALAADVAMGAKEDRLRQVEEIRKARAALKIDFILGDIQQLFDESKEGLSRVTSIVQNLRDFSRVDQVEDVAESDLNASIQATLVVAKNEIKYDADLITELSGGLPMVACHSGQINQVFLNILVNAAHAIKSQQREKKGTITIRTFQIDDDIVCEISDDGPGIPADVLSKIFDPFFTTKAPGKGTGLGLSVSHDIIVNKHKGELLVDSTVGQGTTFTIKLPLSREDSGDEKTGTDDGKVPCAVCE